jgi:hypothetical protein
MYGNQRTNGSEDTRIHGIRRPDNVGTRNQIETYDEEPTKKHPERRIDNEIPQEQMEWQVTKKTDNRIYRAWRQNCS